MDEEFERMQSEITKGEEDLRIWKKKASDFEQEKIKILKILGKT